MKTNFNFPEGITLEKAKKISKKRELDLLENKQKEKNNYHLLKKPLSYFIIQFYPPSPISMENKIIKERYLYDLWQLEGSWTSGLLSLEIKFGSLEERYDFYLYFISRRYKINRYDVVFSIEDYKSNNGSINRKYCYYLEDFSINYGTYPIVFPITLKFKRKDFDKLWKDLLQFCKEKDYIFPMASNSLIRGKSDSLDYSYWMDKI